MQLQFVKKEQRSTIEKCMGTFTAHAEFERKNETNLYCLITRCLSINDLVFFNETQNLNALFTNEERIISTFFCSCHDQCIILR